MTNDDNRHDDQQDSLQNPIEPAGVKLPQDYATPFSAPSQDNNIPSDYPATDTDTDSTEWYNEGRDGAAEVEDKSDDIAVTGYIPPQAPN